MRNTKFHLFSVGTVVALLLVVAVWAGCAEESTALVYSERRGRFEAQEIQSSATDQGKPARQMLAAAETLEDRKAFAEAIRAYQEIAQQYYKLDVALAARIGIVRCWIGLGEFEKADAEMRVLVELYKEFLYLTRNEALWERLRRMWYDDIGLNLFYADQKRDRPNDDMDKPIRVFERIWREEFRGKYAALCLLRIGDCHYIKQNYEDARGFYLRVVTDYPDFQEYHEHEEALYRAALATLGTMKGKDYNLERLTAQGSESDEKGALDLCDDYLKAYPTGSWIAQVTALRFRIFGLLAERDFQAAEAYERQDRSQAARAQYRLVEQQWGDLTRYDSPEVQTWVERARKKRQELGPDEIDK